jgi:hypothetical protein
MFRTYFVLTLAKSCIYVYYTLEVYDAMPISRDAMAISRDAMPVSRDAMAVSRNNAVSDDALTLLVDLVC